LLTSLEEIGKHASTDDLPLSKQADSPGHSSLSKPLSSRN
jgi:hypothetical protein